jgi:hypothetical protein
MGLSGLGKQFGSLTAGETTPHAFHFDDSHPLSFKPAPAF